MTDLTEPLSCNDNNVLEMSQVFMFSYRIKQSVICQHKSSTIV